MDKRLQIVEQLYSDQEHQVDDLVDSDDKLLAEARAIEEMKSLLDSRDQVRPDPVRIDNIVGLAGSTWREGAADTNLPSNVTPLRKPVRHARIYALRMAVAACAVFMVVAVGLWTLGQDNVSNSEADGLALSERQAGQPMGNEEVSAFAESRRPGSLIVDDFGSRSGGMEDSDVLAEKAVADSIPSWSDPDDLVLMRRRIQSLRRASSPTNWDDSIVPLEMMPVGGSTSGIQQASSIRNGNQ